MPCLEGGSKVQPMRRSRLQSEGPAGDPERSAGQVVCKYWYKNSLCDGTHVACSCTRSSGLEQLSVVAGTSADMCFWRVGPTVYGEQQIEFDPEFI